MTVCPRYSTFQCRRYLHSEHSTARDVSSSWGSCCDTNEWVWLSTLYTVNTDAQAQLGTSAAAGVAAVMPMSGCGSMAQTNYEMSQ